MSSSSSSSLLASSAPSSSSSVPNFSFTSFATPSPATALNSPQQTQTQPSPATTTSYETNIPTSAFYLYIIPTAFAMFFCISAGILLRFIFLRRRQRMLEEFLSSGMWPLSPEAQMGLGFVFEESASGSTLKRKRPKIWEAYLGTHAYESRVNSGKLEGTTEWDWVSIRPCSATYVRSTPPPPLPPNESTAPLPARRWALARRLRSRWSRAPSPAPVPVPETETTSLSTEKQLRVAVLIAMPQPPSSTLSHASLANDWEPELPHIEFGVTEIEISSNHTLEGKFARPSEASGNSEEDVI
ncbi:hypothetical protein H0H92_001168 [Tricholoma furcatifolium]|nr:hypothetical protein H0H92_001168 [Tricholoma furcatifolium]